jgi:hypothetical protein
MEDDDMDGEGNDASEAYVPYNFDSEGQIEAGGSDKDDESQIVQ